MESITEKSPAFELAYRFVTETSQHVFLTGKAGTGKTTFLKHLREHSVKRMAVAAPTGVAAINAGGVTLHSMFQLPFGPFVPENQSDGMAYGKRDLLSRIRYTRDKVNFIRNLELLVIDEVSMVSCFIVDAIDTILRSVRKKHNVPFGGVQMLFIGDLHQLPPVINAKEWQILKSYYSSVFFFDSHVLTEHPPVMIELKKIFRQKDEQFVKILNQIRNNDLCEEEMELLSRRLNRNFRPPDGEGYITLTTHNQQAKIINDEKLSRLKSPMKTFDAIIKGDFPEQMFPAEQRLFLKTGAQVMFIKNDSDGKKYFNGKIGIVTDINDDRITVRCDGEEINVGLQEWENINYSVDPSSHKMKEEVLGTFYQFPLRLAWAITIHKSQGLTFDKLVIDAENAFANGQVYVALSRVRSLEGLVLTSIPNRQFLGARGELNQWQARHNDEENLVQKFSDARLQFCRKELIGIFAWDHWKKALLNLKFIVRENKESFSSGAAEWIEQLSKEQSELQITSDKFIEKIEDYWNENPVVEENAQLHERIKGATTYFIPKLTSWMERFVNHPLSADTMKVAGKTDEALHEIRDIIEEIIFKCGICTEGFNLYEYLKRRKDMKLNTDNIRTSYQSVRHHYDAPAGDELYERLSDFRSAICDKKRIPLYSVFSNKTIKTLCSELPADLNSLLNVSGFGQKKVQMYGEQVIAIIRKYCEEKGIQPSVISIKRKAENGESKDGSLSPTVQTTISLFRSEKSTEAICKIRGLTLSTIEGHLAVAVKYGEVEMNDILSAEVIDKISDHLSIHGNNVNWNGLPDGISYGKVKIVLASKVKNHIKKDFGIF